MSNNLQRADDVRIEQILKTLEKIDTALNGNGHPGLIKEHEVVKVQIAEIQSCYGSIKNWIGGSLLVILTILGTFIFGYGRLYKEVESIGELVKKHVLNI